MLVYEHLANVQNKNRLFDLSDGGVFMMRNLFFIVIGLFCSGILWAEIARLRLANPIFQDSTTPICLSLCSDPRIMVKKSICPRNNQKILLVSYLTF